MQQSDIDIINRAKQNHTGFEEIYMKYADKVYNYFWYRVGHQKEVAEDLMQETFVRAFKALDRFQNRGYAYLTYLLTIAHNVLANYYRSHKLISLEEIGDMPIQITEDLEMKLEAENLWKAVQDLSASERDVLLLRYQRGMSIKDIATVMDKSENAVKLILSRGRKKLASHPYIRDMAGFADLPRKSTKARFMKRFS